MKNVLAIVLFISFRVLEAEAQTQAPVQGPDLDTDSLIASPGTPRLISRQFSFTAGATVDKKGNVLFTDQPNNKIWEYTIEGHLTLFLDSAARPNGMYFNGKANLVPSDDADHHL